MYRILLFSVLVCALSASAQSYQIGHVSANFTDSARNNRNIPVEIYYPAQAAGDNLPVADGAFPTLAFGHGFVMGYDAYENVWNALVPMGFVMVFPKTETGILPSHLEFGKDLAFCIATLNSMGTDPDSPFFGKLSGQSAVMGHSMGGGAAILAAQLDSSIDALAVLAPAQTNPSAIAAAAGVSAPALLIAGANDCVTPPSTNQIPMYDALASACKTYIAITGGSHCQMAEFNLLCSLGEATCSPSAAITRGEQHSVIESYLGDWLDAQLKDDCTAGTSFDALIATDPLITFQKNCLQCEALGVAQHQDSAIRLYPNPFVDRLSVSSLGEVNLELFDAQTRKIYSGQSNGSAFDLGHLQSGVYFYRIVGPGIEARGKLIKK